MDLAVGLLPSRGYGRVWPTSVGGSHMKKLLGALGLAVVLVLLPTLATAQTAQVGQVTGEVTDATGGRLPGATVTLTSVDRGVSRTAVTDGQGQYLFALVALGRYDITVTLNGFQT